ncbi:MAG: hypothetical protein WBS14_19995, partial [Rhodomicrobium sp.]
VRAGARCCRRGSAKTGKSTLVKSNVAAEKADHLDWRFMRWVTVRMCSRRLAWTSVHLDLDVAMELERPVAG